jgi:ABC-type multidrug transport system ATPase subunit
MNLLELVDVKVSYGQTQALKTVNLSLREGSIIALIGPNAAGKTTTLKAIIGLTHRRSSGRASP